MQPAVWIETVVKGDLFRRTLWLETDDGTIVDLAGYTAAGQVRAYASAPGAPLAVYTCTIVTHPTPPDALDDPTHHAVQIELAAADTAALPAERLAHDLVLTPPGGGPITYISGFLNVHPRVTR